MRDVKLITRDTDYAVRALSYMAGTKRQMVSVPDLVKELKVPRPFLRKILQILNKKGVLRSSKGKGGGFTLAVAPKKIFLVDLIEIFQGPLKLNECIFKKRACPNTTTCRLKSKIDAVEKHVVSELESVTIASLLGTVKKMKHK